VLSPSILVMRLGSSSRSWLACVQEAARKPSRTRRGKNGFLPISLTRVPHCECVPCGPFAPGFAMTLHSPNVVHPGTLLEKETRYAPRLNPPIPEQPTFWSNAPLPSEPQRPCPDPCGSRDQCASCLAGSLRAVASRSCIRRTRIRRTPSKKTPLVLPITPPTLAFASSRRPHPCTRTNAGCS